MDSKETEKMVLCTAGCFNRNLYPGMGVVIKR